MKRRFSNVATGGAVAAAYFAAARPDLWLGDQGLESSPLWPASGVGMVAVLIAGRWAAISVFAGAFAGVFTMFLRPGSHWLGAAASGLVVAGGETMQLLLAAWLTLHFANGAEACEKPQTVLGFAGIVSVCMALNPTLSILMARAPGIPAPPFESWFTWWVADVASVVVLAPILLTWRTKPWPDLTPRHKVELALLLVTLVLLWEVISSGLLVEKARSAPLYFVVAPLLLWAALRFGAHGAGLAVLVLALVGNLTAMAGNDIFLGPDGTTSFLMLEGFLGVMAIMVCTLVADAAQRQRAQAAHAAFSTVIQKLSSTRTPREAGQIIVDAADRLFGWDSCMFELNSPGEGRPKPILGMDTFDGTRKEVAIDATSTGPLTRQVFEKGAILVLRRSDEGFPPGAVPFGDVTRPSLSLMTVPLRKDEQTLGVLSIQSYRPNAYTDDDLNALQALADVCGGALERIRIEAEIAELNAELEGRVRERTLQLEAINKELEAFSYSVSHDLRAPLRSIRGFSDVLLERYSDSLDARGKDFLRRACASCAHMDQLIDDLLKLSRVGRSELQPGPVNLSALAESIGAELQRTQPERPMEFKVAPGLQARGDERLLRVALENLLQNAWKFTGKREDPRVEFGQLPEPDRAFYVRDNGAGFNMNYVGKLFGVFQRLHTAGEFPGTGVGLATVQRIINRHGGRAWATGAVDQGACFYFTLPATREGK